MKNFQNLIKKRGRKPIICCFAYLLLEGEKLTKFLRKKWGEKLTDILYLLAPKGTVKKN